MSKKLLEGFTDWNDDEELFRVIDGTVLLPLLEVLVPLFHASLGIVICANDDDIPVISNYIYKCN